MIKIWDYSNFIQDRVLRFCWIMKILVENWIKICYFNEAFLKKIQYYQSLYQMTQRDSVEAACPFSIYLFKDSNGKTRTMCEICLKVTIRTPERRHWCCSGVFIINFEHILHIALYFSIVDFEQVIASWRRANSTVRLIYWAVPFTKLLCEQNELNPILSIKN